MMGPDGNVYLVPVVDQAVLPIPGSIGPTAWPGSGDMAGGLRVRKGVHDALDHLPQMPNTMC